MSQMKPYCFKCGAELDPEAIYCPECGRLQRSMVVRAVPPGTKSVPPAPPSGRQSYDDQPQHPDPSQQYSDQTERHPGQPEPYTDQGWYPAGGGQPADQQGPEADDKVYAQRPYPEQPYTGQPYPAQEYPQQPYRAPDEAIPVREDEYTAPETGDAAQDQTYASQDPASAPAEPARTEHGYSEQDYSTQGYPEQGYPEQGYPEQGYPEQGYPEQRYDYAARQYAEPEQPYAYDAYSSGQDPTGETHSDPYGLEDWQRGPARPGPSRVRLIALAGAGLLGLFLVGLAIGHVFGGSTSTETAGTPAGAQSAQPATPTPQSAPSATPAASATPALVGGSARFAMVNSSIPSGCSSRQGCPVQVNLKNNGGRGGGNVTVTLGDQGGNPIATYAGPIPVTDAGGTVQVTGYANGDQLPKYLISGGLVHITNVDIKNG
jgi:zinc-ribbon domain